MDLLILHRHRLQQIHTRQKDVQLALPHLPNHDPHVLLCNPSYSPRSRLQIRRARFNVARSLPLLRRPNRSAVFFVLMALEFGVYLSLCLVHPDAESADAGRCLLHRRLFEEGEL